MLLAAVAAQTFKNGDCEVCLKVLGDIAAKLTDTKDLIKTEKAIGDYCKKPSNDKETKLVRSVFSWGAESNGSMPSGPTGSGGSGTFLGSSRKL